MIPLALVLCLVQTPTLHEITQEMQQMQQTLSRIEDTLAAEPWVVRYIAAPVGAQIRVEVLPQRPLVGLPSIEVRVCRGSDCTTRSWPWMCSTLNGICEARGTVEELLGPGVGVTTFTLTLRAGALTQEWEVAAVGS